MMRRGDLWWASLPAPQGAGPGLRRPVVIIQSNPFNESRIGTVIVAVLTSNLALATAPGNVRIPRTDSGLPKASVVNVSQLMTVDRTRLTKKLRSLPGLAMQRVDEGLRLVIGL